MVEQFQIRQGRDEYHMTRERLIEILCDEFEKAEGLPPNAAEHIEAIRQGGVKPPGVEATLRAMELACRECGGM